MKLVGIEVENLRGYLSTSVDINRRASFIVGPNNAGKTSIIRLTDWLINEGEDDLIRGHRSLNQEELDFLLPARDARHRARRLTLMVAAEDRRSHGLFRCDDGVARLRFNIRLTPTVKVYLSLGRPTRNEPAKSTNAAIELLSRLRKEVLFIHIPSFREGTSHRFKNTLLRAFRRRLAARVLHEEPGGVLREARQFTKWLQNISRLTETLAQPLWTDLSVFTSGDDSRCSCGFAV